MARIKVEELQRHVIDRLGVKGPSIAAQLKVALDRIKGPDGTISFEEWSALRQQSEFIESLAAIPEPPQFVVPALWSGINSIASVGQIAQSAAVGIEGDLQRAAGKRAPATRDGAMDSYLMLISPLMDGILLDEGGRLNLDYFRIDRPTYQEFRRIILEQAEIDDQHSFTDPFAALLAEPKFEPLIDALYHNAIGIKGDEVDPKELQSLVDECVLRFVEIDADQFANAHIASSDGRALLKDLLRRYSVSSEGVEGVRHRDAAVELSKAIRSSVSKGYVANELLEGVDRAISGYNYFNIGVDDGEFRQAVSCALGILDAADLNFAALVEREREYKSGKIESSIGLTTHDEHSGRVKPQDVIRFAALAEKGDEPGIGERFASRLAKLWLFACDDRNWNGELFDSSISSTEIKLVRRMIALKSEELIARVQAMKSEENFLSFHEEIKSFVHGAVGDFGGEPTAADRVFHRIKGRGLEAMLQVIPSEIRQPFDDLKRLTDETTSALDMGERLLPRDIRIADLRLKKATEVLIEGLEGLKLQLWHGYKKQGGLARFVSQSPGIQRDTPVDYILRAYEDNLTFGIGGERGDRWIIDDAAREIDSICDLSANAKGEEDVEREVVRLLNSLDAGGKINLALRAAEIGGRKQMIGLIQSTLLIIIPFAGAARAAALIARMRATLSALEGGAAVVEGSATVAAGASLSNASRTIGVMAKESFIRSSKAFFIGNYAAAAENGVQVLSSQARDESLTFDLLWKDSLATGASMALTGLMPETHLLKGTLIENVAERYAASRLGRSLLTFAGDTGMGTVEELSDSQLRRMLDLNLEPMSLGEIIETSKVTVAGGGLQIGVIAEGIRRKGPGVESDADVRGPSGGVVEEGKIDLELTPELTTPLPGNNGFAAKLLGGTLFSFADIFTLGKFYLDGNIELQSYMNYLWNEQRPTVAAIGGALLLGAGLLYGLTRGKARSDVDASKIVDAPSEVAETFPDSDDTEIDTEPPRTMNFRLPADSARYHPITSSEFAKVAKIARQYSILRKIVESPLMRPKFVASIGSYDYHMSRLLIDEAGNRLIMIGLARVTEDDGRPGLRSTIFYKSQSGGNWRATTHLDLGGIYSKGKYHYTQETQPTKEMIKYLQSREQEESATLSSDELHDAFFILSLGKKTRMFVADAADAHDMVRGSGQLAQVQRLKPGSMLNQGHAFRDYLNAAESIPKTFTPDYRRGPVDSYAYSHSLLGECMIYEYEAEFEGRRIIWGIGERSNYPDERRYRQSAWVEYIRYADAQDTPNGTYEEVIDSGMITNKALEYTKQAIALRSGDPELVALRGELMGRRWEYVDIRRFIGRMPFMEAFYANAPDYR